MEKKPPLHPSRFSLALLLQASVMNYWSSKEQAVTGQLSTYTHVNLWSSQRVYRSILQDEAHWKGRQGHAENNAVGEEMQSAVLIRMKGRGWWKQPEHLHGTWDLLKIHSPSYLSPGLTLSLLFRDTPKSTNFTTWGWWGIEGSLK